MMNRDFGGNLTLTWWFVHAAWHGREAMKLPVARQVGHQFVAHRNVALDAAFADDVQPPLAAPLREVAGLRLRGLGCAQ